MLLFFLGFFDFLCFEELGGGRVEDFASSAEFQGIFEIVRYGGSALVEIGASEERVEVGLGEEGSGC